MTADKNRSAPPEGWLLGIESSAKIGSVALALHGSVIARRYLTSRGGHGAGLVQAISGMLEEAELRPNSLAGVAVGAGPGSFTGVRVGMATAMGLATNLNVPLYTTSSLRAASFTMEALGNAASSFAELVTTELPDLTDTAPVTPSLSEPAQEDTSTTFTRRTLHLTRRGNRRTLGGYHPHTNDLHSAPTASEIRYVLFDARRGRVYGACYDVGPRRPTKVIAPHGGTIVDVLNRRPPVGTCFAGDGAWAHASLIGTAGYTVLPPPAGVPVADAVLACCNWHAVNPQELEPEYVRGWRPG